MRTTLIALAMVAAPVALSAQTASQSGTQTASAPTNIGRWDEFRERQEKLRRKDQLSDERFGVSKVETESAHALVPKQQIINEFSACVWRKSPEKAFAVLKSEIDSSDERKAVKALVNIKACADLPFISGRSGEFRGGLAEAALQGDPSRLQRLGAMSVISPSRVPIATGRAFVSSFSKCIAQANPSGAVALMKTKIGSSEEKAAVYSMGTALTGCMPEGAKYSVDVRDVRNHIADALLRMSEASDA